MSEPAPPPEKGGGWRALRAVLWAFFGVRKGKDLERDLSQLRPLQVIVAGILGAAIFVLTIVTVVRMVTGKG